MKKLLLTILISTIAFCAWAQPQSERARMENERRALQKELQDMQKEYNKIKGQKNVSLGQLAALQNKMNVQARYINNINKEIKILNDDIYLDGLELNRLQRELDTLKAQYARSVVYAYKNRSTYDYLNFIFSASSFNDASKRVAYLRTYREYRQQQVASIKDKQAAIEQHKQQLVAKKTQKSSALKNQTQQLTVLEDQRKEKDAVVAKLKSQEKNLAGQIAAKRKRDKQLRGQIAAIVRREIEKARKEEADRAAAARRREEAERANAPATSGTTSAPKAAAPKKTESYLTLNEGQRTLAANFEKNRGGLPWPVDNGYVSIPFGRSKVGTLDFDNPGITISTPSSGGTVKAVFDGEVSAVSNTGDGMMVMIRHGKYFSVYSNLSSASVNKGDAIRTGQAIGRTATADDGSGGQLDFMIMQEYKNINPRPWLR